MPQSSLDSMEAALKQLKEIVASNHADSVESAQIVRQMEQLISEMKSREKYDSIVVRDAAVVPGLTSLVAVT